MSIATPPNSMYTISNKEFAFVFLTVLLDSDVEDLLNQPWLRSQLGVDHTLGNFSIIDFDYVNKRFWSTGDPLIQNEHYIAELLERGVRVLIYAGTYDFIANWVGNERWTLEMKWSGQEAFVSQELREWEVDGKPAGKTRSSGPLSFATLYGAGHLVSGDGHTRRIDTRRYLPTYSFGYE